MTAPPKNLAASVKARLLALAERRDESFNLLIVRFGVERLLFCISQSQHADKILLKGAMLFAMWDEKTPRPTQDIDLLSFGPTALEEIAAIVGSGRSQAIPTRCNFAPASLRRESRHQPVSAR